MCDHTKKQELKFFVTLPYERQPTRFQTIEEGVAALNEVGVSSFRGYTIYYCRGCDITFGHPIEVVTY